MIESQGGLGLGMHFPGAPVEPDWTKALGVFATEQPGVFGTILAFICIAEGESVGHTGDNWKGLSTKEPGNLGFDPWGLKTKLSAERQEHYKAVEITNGRAAMIAIASMFAFESIPGSVPLMDLFGAQ
jgi:Chlorophyll A-B binding protein